MIKQSSGTLIWSLAGPVLARGPVWRVCFWVVTKPRGFGALPFLQINYKVSETQALTSFFDFSSWLPFLAWIYTNLPSCQAATPKTRFFQKDPTPYDTRQASKTTKRGLRRL